MRDKRSYAGEGGVSGAAFEVEHALSMYALGFSAFPAEAIYDKAALQPLMKVISGCHIYLIGFTPQVKLNNVSDNGGMLNLDFTVNNIDYLVSYEIPEGLSYRKIDGYSFLEDSNGKMYRPDESDMQLRLAQVSEAVNFEVKYIGQAYGKDGSRNAVDRLLKHETLQKIALKGVPKGYNLSLLLLAIEPNTQLVTVLNPHAMQGDENGERIKSGVSKLFDTNEREQVALYEASLIRYFRPKFNIEFKNSFPSTNLKILQNCYERDFSAVIAEICIDKLPYRLCSEEVEPNWNHTAIHDLHKEEDRSLFFGLDLDLS